MSSEPKIDVVSVVGPADRDEVLALAAAAESTDGVGPLDDQVRLDLQRPRDSARNLIARLDDLVAAYGHLDTSDPATLSGHLVVHPDHRRAGLGRALVSVMADRAGASGAGGSKLRLWAHGDIPAAQGFAAALGLVRIRELWQMAGPLSNEAAPPSYPHGVEVRAFEPGRDEDAWVAVNAAAFRHHPEQGRMSRADLEARMAEPWFDPAGFFLAERDGELLGYHWTKVHASRPGHPGRVGEVYVLGVSPAAQGLGLGTALTATGLAYLGRLGLDTVILYVEGDNAPAIAVYEKLGMRRSGIDVMYELA